MQETPTSQRAASVEEATRLLSDIALLVAHYAGPLLIAISLTDGMVWDGERQWRPIPLDGNEADSVAVFRLSHGQWSTVSRTEKTDKHKVSVTRKSNLVEFPTRIPLCMSGMDSDLTILFNWEPDCHISWRNENLHICRIPTNEGRILVANRKVNREYEHEWVYSACMIRDVLWLLIHLPYDEPVHHVWICPVSESDKIRPGFTLDNILGDDLEYAKLLSWHDRLIAVFRDGRGTFMVMFLLQPDGCFPSLNIPNCAKDDAFVVWGDYLLILGKKETRAIDLTSKDLRIISDDAWPPFPPAPFTALHLVD